MKKLISAILLFCNLTYGQIAYYKVSSIEQDRLVVGIGDSLNGKRNGIWHFSRMGSPWAIGQYKNGIKDSIWTFFHNYVFSHNQFDPSYKPPTTNDLSKFKKAQVSDIFPLRDGIINGKCIAYNYLNSISQTAKVKNGNIVDTVYTYNLQGKLSCVARYDSIYVLNDSTKLPFCKVYNYGKWRQGWSFKRWIDTYVYEGFLSPSGHYLLYDTKTKKLNLITDHSAQLYYAWGAEARKDEGTNFYWNGKAEGRYLNYFKGKTLIHVWDMEKGKKIIIKDGPDPNDSNL